VTDVPDDVAALQACLASEQAAVYAYAVIGGRLAGLQAPGDVVSQVDEAYGRHRARRDALDQGLRDLDADPVAAEPAYALPVTPTTVAQCRRLARYLESRCGEAYAYAVGLASPDRRTALAVDLAACAVGASLWGARLEAFPGRPDL
jgi:Domain of unknown function (DUF4439)